jgi:general secretion pathway protein L
MLAAWLVIATGIRIIDYHRLWQQRDDLRAQIEALYREAVPSFPQDKAILDPRKLLERDLAKLTGGGGGPGFIDLIARTGTALKQTPGLEIKSLRSQGGELELDLRITDLQSLDQLKQALIAAAPVDVDIVSATSRDGKVEGRIKIRSKS